MVKNPKRKQLETLMVGRNKDIDNFENIYQSARGMNLRALVISGEMELVKICLYLNVLIK